MLELAPLSEDQLTESARQTLDRVRELFGDEPLPEAFLVMAHVEPFLKDFYMNFKKFVYSDGPLSASVRTAVALATALQLKSTPWVAWLSKRSLQQGYSSQQLAEIAAVVSTNAMYNSFFKFRQLSGSDLFSGMPVGLRAHTFSGTSLEASTIELINTALSNINACAPCTSGHVEKARRIGLNDEQILDAIQCASTIYAGCLFLASAGY